MPSEDFAMAPLQEASVRAKKGTEMPFKIGKQPNGPANNKIMLYEKTKAFRLACSPALLLIFNEIIAQYIPMYRNAYTKLDMHALQIQKI